MTFSTDWDVDQYRVEHESEEHWNLRRQFLVTHKEKYPEERLVCLAQVFYNVEFLGCRYPEEIMRLVAQLSKGVADEHREKMKSKLQRTFVKASDAASNKVKGKRGVETAATVNTSKRCKPTTLPIEPVSLPIIQPQIPGRYVLLNQNMFLKNSPDKKGELKDLANISINNIEIASEINESVDKTKAACASKGLPELKKHTIVIKDSTAGPTNAKNQFPGLNEETSQTASGEDSKGNKIMKLMGWTGGSLGKDKQGIIEPIPAVQRSARVGLGTDNSVGLGNDSLAKYTNDQLVKYARNMFLINTPDEKGELKDLANIIVMEDPNQGPYGIIQRSCQISNADLQVHRENLGNKNKISMSINNIEIASEINEKLDKAKTACASKVLLELKKHCYTIVIKDRKAGPTIAKDQFPGFQEETSQTASWEDSKANKIMKLMGWSGGGLGKDKQGIIEPIHVVQRSARVGLGTDNSAKCTNDSLVKYARKMFTDYIKNNDRHDMVFSADFTKEERAQLHTLASRFNLRSCSYGKGAKRQLVVTKKMSPSLILKEVLRAGGSTDKYDIIPPTGQ